MPYKIKITPTAFNDLQKAIEYYNGEQKGLGKKFHAAVKTMFAQLIKVPASGSFMYDTVRYRVMHKYPYIILYELSYDNINIFRIFNSSKEPFWL
jgi:toxin ParE1/3/4